MSDVQDGHQHLATATSPRYCPRCATALVATRVEAHDLPGCPRCGYLAFRDPKVVAVAVLDAGGGDVWLIRRGIEPRVGQWALPGGYCDFDEHPREAAARECLEEIGCDVVVERLVTVEHAAFAAAGVVVVAYAGRIVAGAPCPGPEALEVARHPAESPPPLAFDTHAAILAAYRRAPGDQGRPSPRTTASR